jgi:hypothetical protein
VAQVQEMVPRLVQLQLQEQPIKVAVAVAVTFHQPTVQPVALAE